MVWTRGSLQVDLTFYALELNRGILYTRYCGRYLAAATIVPLNSDTHDDDAASTFSSADELQPASSKFQAASFWF